MAQRCNSQGWIVDQDWWWQGWQFVNFQIVNVDRPKSVGNTVYSRQMIPSLTCMSRPTQWFATKWRLDWAHINLDACFHPHTIRNLQLRLFLFGDLWVSLPYVWHYCQTTVVQWLQFSVPGGCVVPLGMRNCKRTLIYSPSSVEPNTN